MNRHNFSIDRFSHKTAHTRCFLAAAIIAALSCIQLSGGVKLRRLPGPPGGRVSALAIDPQHPETLYAGGPSGKFYRTTDGGAHWQKAAIPALSDVYDLAVDPAAPSVIYAGTDSGVFKSMDGGKNWRTSSIGIPATFAINPTVPQVKRVVINPVHPEILYAVTESDLVYKSANSGGYWQPSNHWQGFDIDDHYLHISALAIDHQQPDTLYAGVFIDDRVRVDMDPPRTGAPPSGLSYFEKVRDAREKGLYKSSDGGQNWQAVNTSKEIGRILSIVVDPGDSSVVYLGTYQGIFKSADGGASVKWVLKTETYSRITDLAVEGGSPGTVYAATNKGVLWKSADSGENWKVVGATTDGSGFSRVIIHPSRPDNLYAATYSGVLKSANGGSDWQSCNHRIDHLTVDKLAFDPVRPAVLYLGTSEAGLFTSSDSGAHWQSIHKGLPRAVNIFLITDPKRPATLYAGFARQGVYRSRDGGESWQPVNQGLPLMDPSALAIDPSSPEKIYLGLWPDRVYKSTDSGDNWSPAYEGVGKILYNLTVDPASPSTLYAAIAGSYFISRDSGKSWAPGNPPAPHSRITRVMAVPGNPTRLYAIDGRVYKSINGGDHWLQVSQKSDMGYVKSLAIHSSRPETLYAAVHSGPTDVRWWSYIFKSTDGGANWLKIQGKFSLVEMIYIHPLKPSHLFILARGEGLWELVDEPGAKE